MHRLFTVLAWFNARPLTRLLDVMLSGLLFAWALRALHPLPALEALLVLLSPVWFLVSVLTTLRWYADRVRQ